MCGHAVDSKLDYNTKTMVHTCRHCGHIEVHSLHSVNDETLESSDG